MPQVENTPHRAYAPAQIHSAGRTLPEGESLQIVREPLVRQRSNWQLLFFLLLLSSIIATFYLCLASNPFATTAAAGEDSMRRSYIGIFGFFKIHESILVCVCAAATKQRVVYATIVFFYRCTYKKQNVTAILVRKGDSSRLSIEERTFAGVQKYIASARHSNAAAVATPLLLILCRERACIHQSLSFVFFSLARTLLVAPVNDFRSIGP